MGEFCLAEKFHRGCFQRGYPSRFLMNVLKKIISFLFLPIFLSRRVSLQALLPPWPGLQGGLRGQGEGVLRGQGEGGHKSPLN